MLYDSWSIVGKVRAWECAQSVGGCNGQVLPSELKQLTSCFGDREAAIRAGLILEGKRYEVTHPRKEHAYMIRLLMALKTHGLTLILRCMASIGVQA
jgi:hypothetical protein